ncbi:MAG: serine protease [Pseudomonadota bacterium]
MQVNTLAEQLFFTTVPIKTVLSNGVGSGTGFFVEHKIGNETYLFIVTNKHVIAGGHEWQLPFTKKDTDQPSIGNGFTLTLNPSDSSPWFGHPDPNIDVAVCPLVPLLSAMRDTFGVEVFFRSISTSLIPTLSQIQELDALEPVTFVGYPNGIWDSKNLLPVVRRGTTASPLAVDFDGTPCFVIDASVFGGSSGSPVFVMSQGSWTDKRGTLVIGSRFFFVGLIAAVFFRTELNQIISVPIPTLDQPMAEQKEMIDLGVVFKARTVVECIEAFLRSVGVNP